MAKRLAEQRQRQIDEKMQQLTSDDPATRREAVLYLGEAAAGDAVSALIDVYENDEDRGVRRAAAYALGQFRAVERDLSRGHEKKVVGLLEKVENEGKLGKRANRSGLYSSIVLLLFLLALLAGVNYFLTLPQSRDTLVAARIIQPTADPRPNLAATLGDTYRRVRADANTLQAQFNRVRDGGTIDCTSFFNNATPLSPTNYAALPEAQTSVVQINSVISDLIVAKSRYETVCSNPNTPIDQALIDQVASTLMGAVNRLISIESLVGGIVAASAPPTPRPTDIPTTPTQPITLANPRSHLNALYSIVESMISTRGEAALLVQYWEDVRQSSVTGGCSVSPDIPENYVLPPEDAAASPNLVNAVTLINQALTSTRENWTDFIFACSSQNLFGVVTAELPQAQTALEAFRAGQTYLDLVRDSG